MIDVTIKGQQVEVVKAFSAKIGDKLLIINGVCLGLIEGSTAARIHSSVRKSPVGVPPTEADILTALRDAGKPLNVLSLGDALRIDRSDTTCRNILGTLVRGMVRDRHAVMLEGGRFPKFAAPEKAVG